MGGYYAAAAAYFGRKNDISSISTGAQNITTYAVALASPLPRIEIPMAGNKKITIVPFAKTVQSGTGGGVDPNGTFQPTCSIVDFQVLQSAADGSSGLFRVTYEHAEQGSDYDMDGIVNYQFSRDPTKNHVTVTIWSENHDGGASRQHFGYIISGAGNQDGTYLDIKNYPQSNGNQSDAGDVDYKLDTPYPVTNPTYPWKHKPAALPITQTRTFSLGSGSAATLLNDPLWYAAKYGGFTRTQGSLDTLPLQQSEWDSDYNGIPDTYFYVTNPLLLEEQLNKSFLDILKRQSSGTAASVISNSRSGEGAVYQSIFYPWNGDRVNNSVTWVGDVNALLVDANGNLREDTTGEHQLNVVSNSSPVSSSSTDCGDLIVVFDSSGNVTKYKDCNGNSVIDPGEQFGPSVAMGSAKIKYLWQAGTWLNSLTDPATQRINYGDVAATPAGDKRYIFTFVDTNNTMIPASQAPGTAQLPFFSSSLISTSNVTDSTKFYPYLNVYPPFTTTGPPSYIASYLSNSTVYLDFLKHQTQREIDYIRGVDQGKYISTTSPSYSLPSFRSRQYDYFDTGDSSKVVTWRLGDIDYSTPTVVGRPSEGYHLLYSDYSYADFLARYLFRRNVVYVGGNDGMLHAFNAGFYNNAAKQFTTQSSANPTLAQFPLGAELWAYVPYNLLPHLFWLTNPNYAHVYYVDQKPRVFDARIFFKADGSQLDASHPNGWGTVMVVGMRFGGGTVNADLHKSAGNAAPVSTDPQMSSAYIIMDITDPETPPRLLAELKFPGLGYTTCYPAVIPMGSIPSSVAHNDWYLTFGSGPAEDTTEQTKVTLLAASSLKVAGGNAKYFTLDSIFKKYYVWYKVSGVGSDPAPSGYNGIFVALDTGDTANQVATKTAAALNASGALSVPAPTSAAINISNVVPGSAADALPNTSGLAISVAHQGTGVTAGTTGNLSLRDAGSAQSAKLYVVDLKALVASTPQVMTLDGISNTFKKFDPNTVTTTPPYYEALDANSFISDPTVADYQLDYKADAVYFGTVGGDNTNGWTGKLRRIVINNDATVANWNGDSVLFDAESSFQPITAAPTVSTDGAGNRWIFFGTGRLFVNADKNNTSPQAYYGIMEHSKNPPSSLAVDWPTINRSALRNITNIRIFDKNTVYGVVSSTTKSSWSDLVSWFGGNSGWERDFNTGNGERNVGQAALLGSTLIFTTYVPPSDVCDFQGQSSLYALYYTTGTAYYQPVIGKNTDNSLASSIYLGQGLAATPNIHIGGEEGSKAFVQTSTGEIIVVDVMNATSTKSGMKSWRVNEQ